MKGGDFDCGDIPDAAMTLAVVAAMANGSTTIRNVESWRYKETERMKAIVNELGKLGVEVRGWAQLKSERYSCTLDTSWALGEWDVRL